MTTVRVGDRVYWNDAPMHSPSYEVWGTVTEVGDRDMLTIQTDEGERYRYAHQIIVQQRGIIDHG